MEKQQAELVSGEGRNTPESWIRIINVDPTSMRLEELSSVLRTQALQSPFSPAPAQPAPPTRPQHNLILSHSSSHYPTHPRPFHSIPHAHRQGENWSVAFIMGRGMGALCDLLQLFQMKRAPSDADFRVMRQSLRCLRALMNVELGMEAMIGGTAFAKLQEGARPIFIRYFHPSSSPHANPMISLRPSSFRVTHFAPIASLTKG